MILSLSPFFSLLFSPSQTGTALLTLYCFSFLAGYGFAYDDVTEDGGEDQSGKVNAGDPKTFIVAVGGKQTHGGEHGHHHPSSTAVSGGSGSGHGNDGRPQHQSRPSESRFDRFAAKAQKWLHSH